MDALTLRIADVEWILFDRTRNRGGRADCQNNPETFRIMRTSQMEAWSPELRESWLQDLRTALRAGRNPFAEKYGYMMERTAPAEFAEIRDRLPERTAEKMEIVDRICAVQTAWQQEMALAYPALAGRGRPISRREDRPGVTSFETYLWGELSTYSIGTLILYEQHIRMLFQQGRSLNQEILLNTVRQYGYPDLETAEEAARQG